MAWARLASAHHYPSDVAAGTVLGVSVSYPISFYALAASRAGCLIGHGRSESGRARAAPCTRSGQPAASRAIRTRFTSRWMATASTAWKAWPASACCCSIPPTTGMPIRSYITTASPAGHAVSVNPAGTVGYLGNAGQHLLFYDAHTLTEIDRISTLRFETARTSLQGSTHLVWLSNEEIVTPIGEHFYAFRLGDLANPRRLMRHGVKLPHGMKRTASGRYVVYGSMDNPADGEAGEARHVGIWDRETDRVSVVPLPATCWHVAVHPTEDMFYAVSFRVAPQDHRDYHDWGMAFRKEYAFEIDARQKSVMRHWAAGREVPAHINSDITLSDRELIFCNGGSQSIVAIELENFARFRIIDERPDLAAHLARPREVATQLYDMFARGNFGTNSHLFLSALRVSRFSLLDSVYACQFRLISRCCSPPIAG